MADAKGTPQGPDRQKMMTVLVPAVGVAGLILLIAAVALFSGADKGRPMSDGSDGSADDPAMKDLGGGLMIRDLREGTGPEAPAGCDVKVKYMGWLPNGLVFDTGSALFELSGVVMGWQRGIPGMKKGGIRKLVIPPEQGYGAQAKGKIPANSTLIFEVELLDIVTHPHSGGAGGAVDGPGQPMSDGSDGGTSDPGLKDIGGGLKIRDLKEGTGAEVKPGSTVVAHYTGWLSTGSVFDSSRKSGNPATFPLTGPNSVIAGWQRGLPGMKVGGIRKLVIPPEMAYGKNGQPGIPPNSALIFEVEMVNVK